MAAVIPSSPNYPARAPSCPACTEIRRSVPRSPA
ncbi:hypothetical protein [Streptomyces antibioticus]